MKAQVKVGATTILEVEASKQKDLFKAIASAHEVFGEKQCGLCGCKDIRPVWRTVTVVKGKKTETFEFPEYHCQGLVNGRRCGAKLSLGTINDDTGTLYPQRRLVFEEGAGKDCGHPPTKAQREEGVAGDYGPHNGWTRYRGPKDEEK